MGKIVAELSPGQSAGHDPWAWGSKCRPRRAGITGREVPWEPKNGRETRGNICLEIGKKMPEKPKNGNILWGPGNGCDVSGWCWEVYVS